ncbi:hypothetical protein ACXJJ3_32900 [Kribbella sp. WER1]
MKTYRIASTPTYGNGRAITSVSVGDLVLVQDFEPDEDGNVYVTLANDTDRAYYIHAGCLKEYDPQEPAFQLGEQVTVSAIHAALLVQNFNANFPELLKLARAIETANEEAAK